MHVRRGIEIVVRNARVHLVVGRHILHSDLHPLTRHSGGVGCKGHLHGSHLARAVARTGQQRRVKNPFASTVGGETEGEKVIAVCSCELFCSQARLRHTTHTTVLVPRVFHRRTGHTVGVARSIAGHAVERHQRVISAERYVGHVAGCVAGHPGHGHTDGGRVAAHAVEEVHRVGVDTCRDGGLRLDDDFRTAAAGIVEAVRILDHLDGGFHHGAGAGRDFQVVDVPFARRRVCTGALTHRQLDHQPALRHSKTTGYHIVQVETLALPQVVAHGAETPLVAIRLARESTHAAETG